MFTDVLSTMAKTETSPGVCHRTQINRGISRQRIYMESQKGMDFQYLHACEQNLTLETVKQHRVYEFIYVKRENANLSQ